MDGDTYLDILSFDLFVKEEGEWIYIGNIRGGGSPVEDNYADEVRVGTQEQQDLGGVEVGSDGKFFMPVELLKEGSSEGVDQEYEVYVDTYDVTYQILDNGIEFTWDNQKGASYNNLRFYITVAKTGESFNFDFELYQLANYTTRLEATPDIYVAVSDDVSISVRAYNNEKYAVNDAFLKFAPEGLTAKPEETYTRFHQRYFFFTADQAGDYTVTFGSDSNVEAKVQVRVHVRNVTTEYTLHPESSYTALRDNWINFDIPVTCPDGAVPAYNLDSEITGTDDFGFSCNFDDNGKTLHVSFYSYELGTAHISLYIEGDGERIEKAAFDINVVEMVAPRAIVFDSDTVLIDNYTTLVAKIYAPEGADLNQLGNFYTQCYGMHMYVEDSSIVTPEEGEPYIALELVCYAKRAGKYVVQIMQNGSEYKYEAEITAREGVAPASVTFDGSNLLAFGENTLTFHVTFQEGENRSTTYFSLDYSYYFDNVTTREVETENGVDVILSFNVNSFIDENDGASVSFTTQNGSILLMQSFHTLVPHPTSIAVNKAATGVSEGVATFVVNLVAGEGEDLSIYNRLPEGVAAVLYAQDGKRGYGQFDNCDVVLNEETRVVTLTYTVVIPAEIVLDELDYVSFGFALTTDSVVVYDVMGTSPYYQGAPDHVVGPTAIATYVGQPMETTFDLYYKEGTTKDDLIYVLYTSYGSTLTAKKSEDKGDHMEITVDIDAENAGNYKLYVMSQGGMPIHTCEVTVHSVGIVGTINGENLWEDDLSMANFRDTCGFIIQDVHLKAGDKFKVRLDEEWAESYGHVNLDTSHLPAGHSITNDDDDNIVVNTEDDYDIIYYPDTHTIRIYVSPRVYGHTYGLMGTINNWASDIEMNLDEDGIFWAKGVELAVDDQIKVRLDKDWATSYGGNNVFSKPDDFTYETAGDGNLIVKTAGTYDIGFDYYNYGIVIREAKGEEPEPQGYQPSDFVGTWVCYDKEGAVKAQLIVRYDEASEKFMVVVSCDDTGDSRVTAKDVNASMESAAIILTTESGNMYAIGYDDGQPGMMAKTAEGATYQYTVVIR